MMNSVAPQPPPRRLGLGELVAILSAVRDAKPYEASDPATWTTRWIYVARRVGSSTTAERCHTQYEQAVRTLIHAQRERGVGAWPDGWPETPQLRELLEHAAREWRRFADYQRLRATANAVHISNHTVAATGSVTATTRTPPTRVTPPGVRSATAPTAAAAWASLLGVPTPAQSTCVPSPGLSRPSHQEPSIAQGVEPHVAAPTPVGQEAAEGTAPGSATRSDSQQPIAADNRTSTVSASHTDIAVPAKRATPSPVTAAPQPVAKKRRHWSTTELIDDDHSDSSDNDESLSPSPALRTVHDHFASPQLPVRTAAANVTPDTERSMAAIAEDHSSGSPTSCIASPLTPCTATSARAAAAAAAAAIARRFSQPARKKTTGQRPPPKSELTTMSDGSTATMDDVVGTEGAKQEALTGSEQQATTTTTPAAATLDTTPVEPERQTVRRQLENALGPTTVTASETTPATASTDRSQTEGQSSTQTSELVAAIEKLLELERARQCDAKEDRELLRGLLLQQKQLLDEQCRQRERDQEEQHAARRWREQQHTDDMALRQSEVDERTRRVEDAKREREQRRDEFQTVIQCLQDTQALLTQQRADLVEQSRQRQVAAPPTEPTQPHDLDVAHKSEIEQLRDEIRSEREERTRAFAAMYEAIQKSLVE